MRKAIVKLVNKITRDHVTAFAGQAALFFIMSLIPFMLLLLSAVKLTPITEDNILYWLELFAPESVMALMKRIVRDVYHASIGFLIVSLAMAVFSAAKTIQSLQYGLNIVYEIKETRNWLVLRFWAIIETILLLIAMLMIMGLMVFGRQIQTLLSESFPMVAKVTRWIFGMRIWIMFFVLILVLTWIYKVLPNRKATFKSQLIGGCCCSFAWYILSMAIYVYKNTFHGFSLYGSLTTVVIMMFWLYYAFFIFLVCGEINNQFEILSKAFIASHQKRKEKREQMEKLEQEERMEQAEKQEKMGPKIMRVLEEKQEKQQEKQESQKKEKE